MRRWTRVLPILALGAAALGVGGPAPAASASTVVACGQTLTSSTRLANSLVGCRVIV